MLAGFLLRRRRLVLIAAVLFVGVAVAMVAGGALDTLKQGGFEDPDAESTQAHTLLRETLDAGEPNLVLLVTAKRGTVDDPQVAAEGQALARRLAAEPDATQVTSYWLQPTPALRSTDGRQALVVAHIAGDEESEAMNERAEQFVGAYTHDGTVTRVQVGGAIRVSQAIDVQVDHDLLTAEAVSIPITLALLVVVFASAIAALLPVGVGAFAIIGTLLALGVLASLTDVSLYTINLAVALGLGLGIDYSLLIVTRFREELAAGRTLADALIATMRTAGRTVAFSAAAVAASLLALLVFPLYFLRSFGYAGIAVVAMAAVGALVVLPALLAVLGGRINRLALPISRRPHDPTSGAWHRIATGVMRRPLPVAVVVTVFFLLLAAPFRNVEFGSFDDRVLPTSAPSRQVADTIRTNFTSDESSTVLVVARGVSGTDSRADLDRYAARLSALDGVSRVDTLTGTYHNGEQTDPPAPASTRFASDEVAWLSVVPAAGATQAEDEALIQRVRSLPTPFSVLVGGEAAELLDSKDAIATYLPAALAIIATVTLVVLFLLTGSVVLPLKALVLNLLSLTAMFGAMVWVFQEGHLSGLLGFTATGSIDATIPVLMFCVAFGLSMDYEIFLLSRIKEEYDRSGDTTTAVATGLQRTGRIITAAAALLAIVLGALGTARVSFIQMLGLGIALAIVADATLIRGLLVPASMRLLGHLNWWAPRPLRALHDRIGLRESLPEPPTTPDSRPAPPDTQQHQAQ